MDARGDVWTASRVAKVIARTFGVRYHRDHVGKLLTRPRAGADSNQLSEPPSAMKKPSSSGPSSAGPPLKKSRAGQSQYRLGR